MFLAPKVIAPCQFVHISAMVHLSFSQVDYEGFLDFDSQYLSRIAHTYVAKVPKLRTYRSAKPYLDLCRSALDSTWSRRWRIVLASMRLHFESFNACTGLDYDILTPAVPRWYIVLRHDQRATLSHSWPSSCSLLTSNTKSVALSISLTKVLLEDHGTATGIKIQSINGATKVGKVNATHSHTTVHGSSYGWPNKNNRCINGWCPFRENT